MELDDAEFVGAVEGLQTLARSGAPMAEMLEYARANVAVHGVPMLALAAFYRAFDIPLVVATSLGSWIGFSGQNPGVSADDLEAEFGEMLRTNVRSTSQQQV